MDSPTRAAHFALSTVLRDEPWRDLGFHGRPRYGAIVQRFRPQWRVHLEKTALKQMLALFVAAHVHAGVLELDDLVHVVSILVDGQNGSQELWKSYGCTSRREAERSLADAIGSYVAVDPQGWPSLLNAALDVSRVPDDKLGARLFVGSLRFSQVAEDMLPFLHRNAG